jgi:mitogen-activated protein kinase kinase 1 interacting protein 1
VATEHAPEMALRPSYLSTFGMASDQAGKLGVGKNNKIISMYSNYQVHIYYREVALFFTVYSLNFQVIQIYKHPLIISMIAARTANTGQLINLENDLNMIVNDLAQAVVES